ncbi:MAG: DUF2071 domain-containing protein, partial [Planctomycetes bacterium]|nr:DUF2071 domain-containing protein [Planctomycetota bacterium]
EFSATWTRGAPLSEAQPDSGEFFLTERYCLYARRKGRMYRCRIHHRPWSLQLAALSRLESTMVEAVGLPAPQGEPLMHAQAAPLHVAVWRPERVA